MERLSPEAADSEKMLKCGCIYLTELVKKRRETDNITVSAIRTL